MTTPRACYVLFDALSIVSGSHPQLEKRGEIGAHLSEPRRCLCENVIGCADVNTEYAWPSVMSRLVTEVVGYVVQLNLEVGGVDVEEGAAVVGRDGGRLGCGQIGLHLKSRMGWVSVETRRCGLESAEGRTLGHTD